MSTNFQLLPQINYELNTQYYSDNNLQLIHNISQERIEVEKNQNYLHLENQWILTPCFPINQ